MLQHLDGVLANAGPQTWGLKVGSLLRLVRNQFIRTTESANIFIFAHIAVNKNLPCAFNVGFI